MKNFLMLFSFFIISTGILSAYDAENIAVVPDTSNSVSGLMGAICMEAGKQFYMEHDDVFDGLIVFTTKNPALNVQQGVHIQKTAKNIGIDTAAYGPPSNFGSSGYLKQCARAINIDMYPDDPDQIMPMYHISGVELLAHEYGHHWMAAIEYRPEGESENLHYLRGWQNDKANWHWSYYMNSGPSVMYGNTFTDNGDGTFTITGGDRKFSQLDQYLMGLRAAEDVEPFFYLWKDEDIYKSGSGAMPLAKGNSNVYEEWEKRTVTIEDVIRAMGEREPSAHEAQHDFRIAFIILHPPGQPPMDHQIAKAETYRQRWTEWWEWATDYNSRMCTKLTGECWVDEEENDADNGEYPDEDVDESETPDNDTGDYDETEVPDEKDSSNVDDETLQDEETTDTSYPDYNETNDSVEITEDETGCSCSTII